ncbi:OprO/OprP family phosphate-selective porin [Pedobacter sp. MW01-1-1]|uniref:OprO/OprP family phosphate-selective porin n=1 Tax=Pedobacter sp. MW01-1-1 TaxID=3383027 RepID=UPI003FF08E74
MKTVALIVLVFFCFTCSRVFAQNTNLVDSTQTKLLADTNKTYFLPEVKKMKWTNFSNKLFSMQIGFVPILDYNAFFQDETSKQQVGVQENRLDIRSARLMTRGKIFFKNPWTYLISLEYKGLDRGEDDKPFGFTDIMFVIPAGKIGDFSVGKMKETFVYEMVGDAANLPQTERILSPFFVSRNTGVKWGKTIFNERMTLAAGYFNNFLATDTSVSGGANSFTARITGLPLNDEVNNEFVHLGISTRYLEAQNNTIRYKGKNESNITSNYVDTKNFTGSKQWNVGFETLYNHKNFSLLGEYVLSRAYTPTGVENFGGYYITGSYVISGEQRPYDKKAAYARRIKPTGKGGAWEIVGRYSNLDLESGAIDGGKLSKFYFGLNWWATQYWRITTGYGFSTLTQNHHQGVTNSLQVRLQWVY